MTELNTIVQYSESNILQPDWFKQLQNLSDSSAWCVPPDVFCSKIKLHTVGLLKAIWHTAFWGTQAHIGPSHKPPHKAYLNLCLQCDTMWIVSRNVNILILVTAPWKMYWECAKESIQTYSVVTHKCTSLISL